MKYVRQRLDLLESNTIIECHKFVTINGKTKLTRTIRDRFDFPIPVTGTLADEQFIETALGTFRQQDVELIEVKDDWYARNEVES